MNYITRKKERKFKQKLIKFINLLKIKNINLDFPSKIVLIWIIILSVSLFIPWLHKIWNNKNRNAFSNIWWNIWYLMILFIFMILFILFSKNTWEKLKIASNINLKNYIFIIFWSVFIIFNSVIYISFIRWLNMFFEDIKIWKWIVLFLLSWFVIFIWWLLKRNIYYKNEYEIFINETQNKQINKIEQSNMKLPF